MDPDQRKMTAAKWFYITTLTLGCGLITFMILFVEQLYEDWRKQHHN